jgi:ABC-type bacteriocin/lantibiotic exporter with double-glycine peptidase domain
MASAQLFCAITGTLMVVVFPAVTREVLDVVVPQGQWDRLTPLAMMALGAYFAQHLFNSLRIQLNNTFEQKVIYDLRSDIYERLQTLPLRWFDNRPTGDIMTTVSVCSSMGLSRVSSPSSKSSSSESSCFRQIRSSRCMRSFRCRSWLSAP